MNPMVLVVFQSDAGTAAFALHPLSFRRSPDRLLTGELSALAMAGLMMGRYVTDRREK